ncbi:FMN-dependent alpha-hydroxy acid dehydrogenase [Rhizoctonia solani]|uniref:FMN-dependent alpha-hydroxy acid dehydrogenase n=1 Tax=Rhizoctonia solani TaxID=456999 RepID=A0A8H8SWB6_9AGAM|nr:FMN-dependent alpha-hydroxy acid dehydrogenase [Rhizoctonia solani]QRW19033.1 FMN-dependent alpha-hydroxy acid dehydrogenase [Rhizoctonia solani]
MLRRQAFACARRTARTLTTSASAANPRSTRAAINPSPAITAGRRLYAFAFGVGGVTLGLVGYKLLPRGGESHQQDIPIELSGRLIPFSEVQKHNTRDSCWVVINGEIYDVTGFLNDHPGGIGPILKVAGSDATRVFVPIHPPDTLSTLPPTSHVGTVDPTTLPAQLTQLTAEELRIKEARANLPSPEAAINLADIEKLAQTVLTQTAWAYYRSAGDDEFSYRENNYAFRRYWFRPRVMNKVSEIQTSTTILGIPTSLPIFVSPAALARLGHPDGEVGITRGVASEGIIQGVSINASCSLNEINDARSTDFSPSSLSHSTSPGQTHSSVTPATTTQNPDASSQQPLIFQIYLNKQRDLSKSLLQKSNQWVSEHRRTKDEGKFTGPAQYGTGTGEAGKKTQGVAQAISGYQDPDVCWDDIAWIRSITKLPLVVKGIQCVEDAEKAYEHGVEGIVLSNHGGRELDFSPAPIDILHELRQKRPDIFKDGRMEVFIDGGIRRGTDVLKALCLGAKAVGLGRPFLYANAAWGEDGVRRCVQIMREEIETGMRLLGVTRVEDLGPHHVKYMDREPAPIPRTDSP